MDLSSKDTSYEVWGDEYRKYSPQLLINNPATKETVLSTVTEELLHCQTFMFIVAFVTESGLATLKSYLLDLKRKGIGGRLLTSTYLNFNNPKVFKELLKIENLEVRLTDLEGFHSKGYIFRDDGKQVLIVGSANLTAQALKVNYEWNVKLTVNNDADIIHQVNNQFNEVWEAAQPLSNVWIANYEIHYIKHNAQKIIDEEWAKIVTENTIKGIAAPKIVPNKMQQLALRQIEEMRLLGSRRSLIISATGTGKTFLSAFDVQKCNPRRMLFIVHREQILSKAKDDYYQILGGNPDDFGIYSGTQKHSNARYLFATIQSISRVDVLNEFGKEDFDYILIDEVHKAGAQSYRRVIDYFKPKFLMGMTATPERTDDFNIYELFDHNVAFEIRLQQALEEDMLCPFHYFGVTDLELDGQVIDDFTLIDQLVTDERVQHLIEKIEYYGFSGERVRGLIFCSRKEEARQLSYMLNQCGYNTVALTGDDSIEEREKQTSALEQGLLDYILTVDIFNEGIDIPSVNQVVMLRQTQSSIIFIQQLGRGLRKHDTKEYVTIIDFIGNYKNNYLIPIALSGDRSLNKDSIRRKMKDTSYISGVSSINFEEVAKERIFKAINAVNLTEFKKLKDAYKELKNRLGRIPKLIDFIQQGSLDPVVIVNECKTLYHFLLRMKEEVKPLSIAEERVLIMLSEELMPGKRRHEIILLELLLSNGEVTHEQYIEELERCGCRTEEEALISVKRVMDLSFFTQPTQEKYGNRPICELGADHVYRWSEFMYNLISKQAEFTEMLRDIVDTAKEKAKDYLPHELLSVFRKYSRKDVCRLLNWVNDESSTVYGYKTKHQTCPIFITYHKHDEVESSINYGDELLSPKILKWFTRSNRTLQSEEVKKIIEARNNNIDVHIFIKKDDDEGSDFYYLGKALPDTDTVSQTVMSGKEDKEIPVVTMHMVLDHAVEPKLYRYLVTDL
ncbi:DUF3427 domain-containing protein [Cohnella endophytica]|uniref:DUF3427 domain-containing protein n=1 Tax=Cohnella endophytica TaxID=2419778 RepID=A0A494XPS3_9BACL|nr:DEAD/DEAH box helicase [Cohnella endophytica]RKP50149.1 DUF3427 domain-containing protein [Cohnella endophytica]